MKPRIALRIEVPDYRAAHAGVPPLAELLQRHHAGGSFLFAFGPDWLGRSAAREAAALRRLRDDGFEVGVSGWQPARWIRQAERAEAAWHADQLGRATAAFEQAFGMPPRLHAAPGWRSDPHALRLTQRLGFACASDCRGRFPFVPVWNGEIVRCFQIPTTLPTLDELADGGRPDPQVLKARLLALTATPPAACHVFSLAASPAIAKQAELIEGLLAIWSEQGYEVVSVQAVADDLEMDKLPRHEVVIGRVPGRAGTLLVQGEEFLSAWRNPT